MKYPGKLFYSFLAKYLRDSKRNCIFVLSITQKKKTMTKNINLSEKTKEEKRVAATILHQLGGRRFMIMTGSKPKYCGRNDKGEIFCLFQLAKNQSGAKYLKIYLTAMDDYRMEFLKEKRTKDQENSFPGYTAWNYTTEVVAEYDGVYNDMLATFFEETTGLYTSL